MDRLEKFLTFLSMFEISNKKIESILNVVEQENLENVSQLADNGFVMDILSTKEYHEILPKCDDRLMTSYLTNLKKDGIQVVTKYSESFPESLIDLPDAPLLLYAKGDLSLLKEKNCLAMVGTRTPTNYGKYITDKFAEELAKAGCVIVSGLAYGVDSLSHRKALEVGGKTISVLGGGFNHVYPEANTNLANEIAEKGLLLSEYCPSARPTKYSFPKRNRIIAGLSKGILITEAGKKSGTIHTKDFALEYGKDVFAVPGNVNSEKSSLPNELIKSGQAECVLCANDILEYYGIEKAHTEKITLNLNMEEQIILNLLKDGEKDFDYLAKNSQIPVNFLNSYLTTMEIRGLIRRLPAKTYMLN